MSTRFTFPLLTIFAIIAIVSCIQVTKNQYKNEWKCNWLCNMYNSYHNKYPNQACNTLNGTPKSCEKKSIQLYNDGKEIFENHSLLKCVNDDGAIVGYLTAGREDNEYLEWYNSNGGSKYYPFQYLNYIPSE